MDPTPIGTALGAALTTFVATWRGLIHPLKKQLPAPEHLAKLAKIPKDLPERLATLESENREMRRRLDEQAKTIDDLEARVNRTVTSEEFAAHAGTTAQAVQNLSEKVGQAKGAIETWLSTLRR